MKLVLKIRELLINNLVQYLGFSLAILSILFSINSDIIVQNNTGLYDQLFLPATSLFGMNNAENDMDYVIGRNEISSKISAQKEITYIFVIDVSGSTHDKDLKPSWFDKDVGVINKRMIEEFQFDFKPEKMCGLYLSAVKVSKLILDLEKKTGGITDKFSVWRLGDKSEIIYPNQKNISKSSEIASPENLLQAIQAIHQLVKEKMDESKREQNTDFYELFDKLNTNYALTKSKNGQYLEPSFVVIIAGDLVHDVEKKLSKYAGNKDSMAERMVENKSKLIDMIHEISKGNMLANIILLSGDFGIDQEKLVNDLPESLRGNALYTNISMLQKAIEVSIKSSNKIYVWPYLEENLSSYRLKRTLISESNDDILYANVNSINGVTFYYTNPYYIPETLYRLKMTKYGEYRLGLTNIKNNLPTSQVNIDYQVLTENNELKHGAEYSGKLLPGGEISSAMAIQDREKIQISYNGRLPLKNEIPKLVIYHPREERKAYVISIDFIKKLPWFSAIFMLLLEIFLCYLIIELFVKFCKSQFAKALPPIKTAQALPGTETAQAHTGTEL